MLEGKYEFGINFLSFGVVYSGNSLTVSQHLMKVGWPLNTNFRHFLWAIFSEW